jgi:predicted small lipoprotein YifL
MNTVTGRSSRVRHGVIVALVLGLVGLAGCGRAGASAAPPEPAAAAPSAAAAQGPNRPWSWFTGPSPTPRAGPAS